MVMTLALLVYAIAQRRLHKALARLCTILSGCVHFSKKVIAQPYFSEVFSPYKESFIHLY